MASKINKLLTFYIDVGQLDQEKSKAHVASIKADNKELLDRLPDNVGVLWLPVRHFGGGTKVKICDLT